MPDRRTAAWIAAHRFGMGARPGELDAIAGDPRGWLLSQLAGGPPPSPERDALPGHMAIQRELMKLRAEDAGEKRKAGRRHQRATLRAEARARLIDAATTDAPFHERLVRFWSDHVTTSANQRRAKHLVGAHEREAVRPHVTGRFADLLLASTQHPAMLLYLDNASSIGPDTRRGQRREAGLNENLAREILELHTLGVGVGGGGGYQQADVVALAELITGWTVFGGPPRGRMDLERPHGFTFRPDLHQPGRKALLGRRYSGGGVAEGESALRDLAAHPSTPRFLASKLCRHFLGAEATPSAVNAVSDALRTSGGDLKAAAHALVEHPASWTPPAPGRGALRAPSRLLVAMARAVDLGGWSGRRKDWADKVLQAQAWLGQPTFTAPSPAGWSDDAADWTGPEQVLRRVELAFQVGTNAASVVADPGAWADDLLAPVLDADTRLAVGRAGSRAEAIALALASPAFQWT